MSVSNDMSLPFSFNLLCPDSPDDQIGLRWFILALSGPFYSLTTIIIDMKTFNLITSIILLILALYTMIHSFATANSDEFVLSFIETLLALIFYAFYFICLKDEQIHELRTILMSKQITKQH